MLAEQLNNSGWQERLAACQMLHRLHGGINKDVCSKLVVLVWEDWSPEVRQAAAQALGLTGHGKVCVCVFSILCDYLYNIFKVHNHTQSCISCNSLFTMRLERDLPAKQRLFAWML